VPVGELARALRLDGPSDRAHEVGDVLAWLASVASIARATLAPTRLRILSIRKGTIGFAMRPSSTTNDVRSPTAAAPKPSV
jgi:hypothetical protein